MKRYDTYIQSPIPWVKQLPAHWEVMRAKYMYKKESRPVRETDGVITCFRDGTVTLRSKRRTTGFTESIQENGYQGIRKGDLVIHVMDAFAGAVGVSDSDGKGTPVYSVCTAKGDYNNKYYAHIVRIMAKTGFILSLYRGIRERSSDFRFEVFSKQFLPVPPRSEQDQIVRYLDWQVSKINKLIAAKKKKITLLNEQKQVIINNAVTKGLDPMAQMKDSGIEWIGTIPQEWSISRLKTQVSLATSKKVRNDELYIGMENIQSWTGMYVCATSVDSEGICNVFENNNILFGKLRPYLAKVYLTNSNGVCSSEFLVIRSFSGCMKYLFYVLLSYKFIDLVNSSTYGAKMPRANWSFIGNCSIPVPPLKEQIKIVLYLDERCNAIENIKSNIQNEVKLLYEYRTRLISDVVTGQIDVRDIEIPDYEYVEEESDEETDETEGADEEVEEQEE